MKDTDQIAAEAQTCCAHLKVIYRRINNEGGTCSDSWKCADCGHKFIPEAWHKVAIEKATEAADKRAKFCSKIANERLEEIAQLKSRAAHASEQDTKRLDWLLSRSGVEWIEANLDYLRAGHRRPYCTNAIDAAMSSETEEKKMEMRRYQGHTS